MKPTSDAERFNRARKVSAIIEYLDFTLDRDPVGMLNEVSRYTISEWAAAAASCGQNAPSRTSIEQILKSYRDRAATQQEAS